MEGWKAAGGGWERRTDGGLQRLGVGRRDTSAGPHSPNDFISLPSATEPC